jgi:hypothetical protein
MHTPNQGLIYTFKFSAVLIICSLLWVFPSLCSLPAFPFPRSLPEAVSGVCDSHESPPLQVCAFPSLLLFPLFPALFPYWRLCPRPLSLLTIMSPPSFPIDDYVPALFSYFRLCSFSLSLFLIMPWHSLSLMSLCYFYKIVESAILCSKYLSERTGQLLFMHKNYVLKCHIILVQRSPLEIMSARALLNNECSSPPK